MAGANASRQRFLMVALCLMACSALSPPLGGGMCVYRTHLPTGSFMETRPWSFLRTIDILAKKPRKGEDAKPTAAPLDPETNAQLVPTTPAPWADKQGTVRAALWTLTSEYHLEDRQGNYVAKIVNPAFPWDMQQEIYNCKEVKVGWLTGKFSWSAAFWNRYESREVRDALGNHVANLVREGPTKFFGSPQHMLVLKNLKGQPLVSMRHAAKGWTFGPFGESWEVRIEFLVSLSSIPAPANNAEVLSLIFTNQMASNNTFGPYWVIIMTIVFLIAFPCCCIFCCCIKGREREAKPTEKVEEQQSLIEEQASPPQNGGSGSVFSCCSRRQVAPAMASMPSANDVWASANSSASAGWGRFKTNVGAR